MVRIAVVGSGISGMSAAWLLSQRHSVDVFEAEDRLGGHTRTLDIHAGGSTFPVDTGFMVFNRRTYPNLTRFFEYLDIDAADADMSFSVQVRDEDIEWSGSNLDTVFAQRKNVTNPRFLRMLADVVKLSRSAEHLLADPKIAHMTLGEVLRREGYSDAFTDWYLIPMGDAIWSTPPGDMLDYPALTFLRFCDNHGLLHIFGKPLWLSVRGGARRYLDAVGRTLSGEVFLAEPVERIERTADGVRVSTSARSNVYDAVVCATHPPQTRTMLADQMSQAEREILGSFDFWPNDVVVHTDESFMPKSPRAWASWNWYSNTGDTEKAMLMLTYRINTLQELPGSAPSVLETLNRDREPAAGSVLARLAFDHPMFTRSAIAAQAALPSIQGVDRIWYAGAWTRYGFHEDGILSGVHAAEALGAVVPWGDELDETRTMVLPGVKPPLLGQTRRILDSELPLVASQATK